MVKKIIPVFKPPGFPTYDLVRLFKKETGFRGKIGHAGTLDPFASGVVLLLLSEATKKFEEIKKWEKVYLAGIRLGASSSTQDIIGEIKILSRVAKPSPAEIQKVLSEFEGETEQKVPFYSAAKFRGKPLYKLARRGEKICKTKKVRIKKIDFLFYCWPLLTIRVTASGGTYIRQLAEDIGVRLGGSGFLYFLQRERVGKYSLKDCLSWKDFKEIVLQNKD